MRALKIEGHTVLEAESAGKALEAMGGDEKARKLQATIGRRLDALGVESRPQGGSAFHVRLPRGGNTA